MVEESPYIVKSISRILPTSGHVSSGVWFTWPARGWEFVTVEVWEIRLPSLFFPPFSLRNKQRRRRRLSYKSFSKLLLTWAHSKVVPRETEDNAYAKSCGSNNAFCGDLIQTPWRLGYLWFYTRTKFINIPRDSPLAKTVVEYLRNGRTFN